MTYAVVDVETSIINDGNPFSQLGKLCLVGILDSDGYTAYPIEYGELPYGKTLAEIQRRLDGAAFVVGFNIKFDLHWLRRYGIRVTCPVYDAQLAEFVLVAQSQPYPSLNECATKYGFSSKVSVVSDEYWSKGIDTPDIPWKILAEYNEQDCRLTEAVFKKQRDLLTRKQQRLVALQCEDLVILQEMEWNGLKYDLKEAEKRSEKTRQEIAKIDGELRAVAGTDVINWASSDHLSCLLYGGVVYERYRETYTRILKGGKEKEVERWSERPVKFPRLVKPLKRTETAPTKGLSDDDLASVNQERNHLGKRPFVRHWSVAEPILRRLPAKGRAKRIIGLLLKRAELEKLDSTYYGGLIEKHRNLNWPPDTLHGQFNQCVATTGRLSSSNPNLQNFAKEIKDLFYTRYVD